MAKMSSDRRRWSNDWGEISPARPLKGASPSAGQSTKPEVKLMSAEEVATSTMTYLWPPTIARGQLTVMLAPAGCTSALMTELAAKASVGGSLPQCPTNVPSSQVAMFAPEARIKATIRPQLEGAGADLARIHFPSVGGKLG